MYQNYTTQNEKIERISEKTLVIGVDIAKDKHYAQVINWRKQEVRKGLSFQNRKEGYEKFLRWMQKALKQTEAEDVLVAMEPTGTYYFVFEEYLEQMGIEVAIVNGRDVRRTSEIMGNDSSKNDPRDALITMKAKGTVLFATPVFLYLPLLGVFVYNFCLLYKKKTKKRFYGKHFPCEPFLLFCFYFK